MVSFQVSRTSPPSRDFLGFSSSLVKDDKKTEERFVVSYVSFIEMKEERKEVQNRKNRDCTLGCGFR